MAHGCYADGHYWLRILDTAVYRFSADEAVITAFPAPEASSLRITDSFYRHVIPLWFHVRGLSVLHASAVGTPGGLLVFCAPPYTGKSTLAFGLSRRGHPLYADDAIAFQIHDRAVQAIPIPFFLRLRSSAAAHFGTDARKLHAPEAWRRLVSPPERRVGTICVLERLPDEPGQPTVEVVRCPALEAFNDLLGHLHTFGLRDASLRRTILKQQLELASRVPVFRVRFASRLDRIDAVLDALEGLDEASLSSSGRSSPTPIEGPRD